MDEYFCLYFYLKSKIHKKTHKAFLSGNKKISSMSYIKIKTNQQVNTLINLKIHFLNALSIKVAVRNEKRIK